MRIAGAIVAGGRSLRMGQEKAFVALAGQPLLAHVVARIAPQVDALVLNANGDARRFASFDLPVIPDLRHDRPTPVAGLAACLGFAADRGFDAVLTMPADTPFLPRDLVRRLRAAAARAAIAASGGQDHYLTGLWSVELRTDLDRAMDGEALTRVQDWARRCAAVAVSWPALPFDPFFNVNTPGDLAEAARIAADFAP